MGRVVLLWGHTNPQKFLDFNHRGGSRCPHRDCQTGISRRDGAIHLARSPEPFRDWYHCEFRSETVGLFCEWQTGTRDRALQSFREALRLSRAYQDEDSVADAMLFSPAQVVVIGNLLLAGKN